MKIETHKLTLDQQVTYQVKVPGHLDQNWVDWDSQISLILGSDDDSHLITTLTGNFDQAALIGL